MSFPGTHTPIKPTGNARYQLPMRPGRGNVPEYYMTPELEQLFIRKYPRMTNVDLMKMFGIGFSTLHRFARHYGLEKDMKVIRHKQAQMTRRICEKNGYYDSLRGKRPSLACQEGCSRKWAEGFHPMKTLKEKSPKKYAALMKAKSEALRELWRSEARRLERGLTQKTRLHRPQFNYSRSQYCHRSNALKRGYLVGSIRELSGQRYNIYYDKDTCRSAQFEKNLVEDGFRVLELNPKSTVRFAGL